ncbi:hypothetical protein [Nocardia sp. NPDC048505]|uniref:hypothetical protein n=1 Tax=unclassified Nocardia TaxID=2637762 RepID=UPI0033F03209
MPKLLLSNPYSDKTLTVMLEPYGEDYWMRPGDAFIIEFDDADYSEHVVSNDAQFDVSWHEDGIIVWPAGRFGGTVRDQSGTELPCGHQRPEHVDRAWRKDSGSSSSPSSDGPSA